MIRRAPPGEPEAQTRTDPRELARTMRVGASGGVFAFACLVVVAELLALAMALATRAFGLWSWAKVGLLTALLSLRSEVVATVAGPPFFREAAGSETFHWRLVPMLLTLGFVVLAARAGRRAARTRPGGSSVGTAVLAAAGAAVSVGALAALAAAIVTLRFASVGTTLRVDVGSATLWGGITAAAGAGAGAFLERSRGRLPAAALRGGLGGYGWALVLLAVGVVLVATLEPGVTRGYIDVLGRLGEGGTLLFGSHLLAFPAQSALLLAPASGACLRLVGESGGLDLCPWTLTPVGPAGLLTERLSLTPWLWSFEAVPPICAALAGRRAAFEVSLGPFVPAGSLAGVLFAATAVAAAWYVSPRLPVLVIPELTVRPDLRVTAAALTFWGLLGGALGGWLAARRYEEPDAPMPTSV